MNASRENLEDRIKQMIITRLRLKMTPAQIDIDQQLFGEELGLDSIDALELVMGLEKEFGIAIEDAAEGERVLQTVRTIAEFIRERQGDS